MPDQKENQKHIKVMLLVLLGLLIKNIKLNKKTTSFEKKVAKL
jgi:hypothetical protein